MLVLQIAIPVGLAPIVGGESWAGTPLGGWVLIGAMGLLSVGVLLLAGSKAVADVLAENPEVEGEAEAAEAAQVASS